MTTLSGQSLLQEQAQAAVLSLIAVAIFVVDEGRQVLFSNPAGDRLLRAGDALRLSRRMLVAVDPTADALLQTIIIGAAGWRDGFAGKRSAVAVPRHGKARPLNVTVVSISESRAHPIPKAGIAAAIVFAKNPDDMPWSNLDFIAYAYTLTRAERHFLEVILQSEGIAHAAEKLKISRSTASTHLQHIYAKTGTARQVELMHLVASHQLPLED